MAVILQLFALDTRLPDQLMQQMAAQHDLLEIAFFQLQLARVIDPGLRRRCGGDMRCELAGGRLLIGDVVNLYAKGGIDLKLRSPGSE